MPNAKARNIAEALLRRSGDALISGDFEMLSKCFHFPNTIETIKGAERLENPEDLRKVFDGVRLQFRRMGVSLLERHVVAADFRDERTITSTHQTRLFNGTQLLQAPFPVFSVVTLGTDGVWRIKQSMYGLEGDATDPIYTTEVLRSHKLEKKD